MFMKRMKLNPFLRMCFAFMFLTIFPLIGCGGGGGGGSSSSAPPPTTPSADISVSRTQIAFGDTVVDRSSQAETISVQNTAPAFLNIGQIVRTNSSPSAFSILNDNCSLKSLWQGETCTFQIQFSPSAQGAVNGAINIPSNDPDAAENPVVVNVSGTGRSLYVSLNELSCPSRSLFINVTDKDVNSLVGLQISDLTLRENDSPRTITRLYEYTETISAALVLDYSSSMTPVIPALESAAENFINRLNTTSGDEAAVIKFRSEYKLMQDFTSDKGLLINAVRTPFTTVIDETALYDTLFDSIGKAASRTTTDRRAVVVITDGLDTFSTNHSIDGVIAEANMKKVPLYTIGLGTGADVTSLKRLANETGGAFFYSPTADDLKVIYLQIAGILVGQYVIEYTSQLSGSITLDLTVNLTDGRTGRAVKSFSGCP